MQISLKSDAGALWNVGTHLIGNPTSAPVFHSLWKTLKDCLHCKDSFAESYSCKRQDARGSPQSTPQHKSICWLVHFIAASPSTTLTRCTYLLGTEGNCVAPVCCGDSIVKKRFMELLWVVDKTWSYYLQHTETYIKHETQYTCLVTVMWHNTRHNTCVWLQSRDIARDTIHVSGHSHMT